MPKSVNNRRQSPSWNVDTWREYPQVNLNNFYSIKKVIDDALIRFIQANGYQRVNWYGDVRMILTVCAIGFGLLSQFYFKFPQHKVETLGCIIAYVLLTGAGTAYEWWNLWSVSCRMKRSSDNSDSSSISEVKPFGQFE